MPGPATRRTTCQGGRQGGRHTGVEEEDSVTGLVMIRTTRQGRQQGGLCDGVNKEEEFMLGWATRRVVCRGWRWYG